MVDFDFHALTVVLVRDLQVAFEAYADRFPGHQLYTFGPYTSGEFGYIVPTASSVQGLDAVVARYKSDERYANIPAEHLAHQLKWSPCDSPLHEEITFSDELDELASVLGNTYDSVDDRELDAFVESAHVALCTALTTLDQRGVFGRGDARPLLNVWKGDQPDAERVALAEVLNPEPLVERFRADLRRPTKQS